MKRLAFVLILFCVLTTQAATTLTLGQVEALAKTKFGVDARLISYAKPTATSWTWTYEIRVQEYHGYMIQTPFGFMPNPRSGQPLPELTLKGSGTSWQKAWESVK